MSSLSKEEIRRLLSLLNQELANQNAVGELYLVGGAVMSLVFDARPSTQDVDAFFRPATEIRKAAKIVAARAGVSEKWLNDAVKGFLGEKSAFATFLELSNLKIFTAQPEYLLAMKCLAMRIGEEFHDYDDVRFLLRYLNIESYQDAVGILTQYYPLERFPQKTLYALEELLEVPESSL